MADASASGASVVATDPNTALPANPFHLENADAGHDLDLHTISLYLPAELHAGYWETMRVLGVDERRERDRDLAQRLIWHDQVNDHYGLDDDFDPLKPSDEYRRELGFFDVEPVVGVGGGDGGGHDLTRSRPWETPYPQFPYDALPKPVNDYLDDWAESMSQSKELGANAFLGAFSAICNHHRHEVSYRNNWNMRLNIFMLLTGEAGFGKSPAFKATTAPLKPFRKHLEELSQERVRDAKIDLKGLKRERDKLEKDITNTVHAVDPEKLDKLRDMEKAVMKAEDDLAAKPYKLYTGGDVTPEAFAARMASNNYVMSLLSEEGGFFGAIDRYSKPGSTGDLDALLGAFDGGDVEILRKTTGDIEIEGAYSTFMFGVQPEVVDQLLSNPVFVSRGLAARFIMAAPPLPEKRRVGRKTSDTLLKHAYDEWMNAHCYPEFPGAQTVIVDGEAAHAYDLWADAYEPRINAGGDDRAHLKFFRKLEQVVLRMAGLLHLMHRTDPSDSHVSVETMSSALALGDYWMAYQRRFAVTRNHTADDGAARALLSWVERQNGPVTFRQMHRSEAAGGDFVTSESLQDLVAKMLEWGWLANDSGENWRPKRGMKAAEFWATESEKKSAEIVGCLPDILTNISTESDGRSLSVEKNVWLSGDLKRGGSDFSLSKYQQNQQINNLHPQPPDNPTISKTPTAHSDNPQAQTSDETDRAGTELVECEPDGESAKREYDIDERTGRKVYRKSGLV